MLLDSTGAPGFMIRTGLLKLVTLFHYQAEVGREALRDQPKLPYPRRAEGIVIEGEYERLSEKPLTAGKSRAGAPLPVIDRRLEGSRQRELSVAQPRATC